MACAPYRAFLDTTAWVREKQVGTRWRAYAPREGKHYYKNVGSIAAAVISSACLLLFVFVIIQNICVVDISTPGHLVLLGNGRVFSPGGHTAGMRVDGEKLHVPPPEAPFFFILSLGRSLNLLISLFTGKKEQLRPIQFLTHSVFSISM